MLNLSFTIKKPNNKVVTIRCETDGKYLYRGNTVIRCSCNREDPTPYIYDGDIVYCPSCFSTSLNVSIIDDTTDLYLYYIGMDFNTMQDLYKLSSTLPYNEWLRVSEHFVKLTPSDVDLEYPLQYIGWVTSTPHIVEQILNVPVEKWVSNRDVEAELMERISKESKVHSSEDESYYFDFVDKLHEVFSVVETPYGQFDLQGEIVENPLFPPNEYGTGEYWVINEADDEIWYVRYNHRPGDNLNFNNVLVDGELGAIGKVVGFDENIIDLLNKLKD